MDFDNPDFKVKFWEWFDRLPRPERKKFQEYPSDMAELFFYNKYYSRGIDASGNMPALHAGLAGPIPASSTLKDSAV